MPTLEDRKLALIVYRDLAVLSAFQHAFTHRGYTVVLARDLATALLAITHHYFEVAVVSCRLAENGDGFPLAGIIQRIFPEAAVSVLSLQVDVPQLLSAINHGVRKVVDVRSGDADFLVASALGQLPAARV